MAIDPFDEAIKEAYASNEDDRIILNTIEIYPASLSVPARLVLGYVDFTGTLESDAPKNPGEAVLFQACQFKISLPESSDRLPMMELSIDNVSQIIGKDIDAAMDNMDQIPVIHRQFIESDVSPEPHYILKNMTLKNINVGSSVTGSLYFSDYTNRQFPNEYFTPERFPGLVR